MTPCSSSVCWRARCSRCSSACASAARARARAVLSGNSPFGCFHAPRTPEGFAESLYGAWMATGRRPRGGRLWVGLLHRARARAHAVFTHRLKGRTGEFTFLAGTELRAVEAAIRKAHGRTFWSTPTMQRISIGSWLARSCHGNSGAAGKPSSHAAARVLVVDLTTREAARGGARWVEYATIKHDLTPTGAALASRRSSLTPSACRTTFGCRSAAPT